MSMRASCQKRGTDLEVC